MHCPFCRHPDSRVVDSRETDEGQAIRRRRSCPECGRRFTTVETAVLAVVKRSGVTEPFSREKVISGVRRACQGRQVDDDALNLLAQQVEDTVRAAGSPESAQSTKSGLAILGPLRELDEVAYLRFASVYRSFSVRRRFRARDRGCARTAASRTGRALRVPTRCSSRSPARDFGAGARCSGPGPGAEPVSTRRSSPSTTSKKSTFAHVGKPFLTYGQKTKAAADGKPLHAETGYLRVPQPGHVEIVLAHPSGITEIEVGTYIDRPATIIEIADVDHRRSA